MIDGTVTAHERDRVVVSVAARPACSRCLEGGGCGMGLLGRQSRPATTVTLSAPEPRPEIGSPVRLTARPGVLGGALLGYGLPLAGVLAGAASGPVVAAAGLLSGLVVARALARGRVRWRLVGRGSAR